MNDIRTIQNKISDASGEIVMYQPDETIRLEVRLGEDTVWLSQQQMAELFQKDQSVIARHVKNVFNEGELDEKSNMQILHNTKYKYRPTKVYNLDVIISVGYRVKSKRGTLFRQWANKVLKDYLLKGYSVNKRFEQLFGVSHQSLCYCLRHLRLLTEEELRTHLEESAIIQDIATEYGYDLSLYQPGNEGVVIGDFGEKARLLFEQERISEGHYVELLNLLK